MVDHHRDDSRATMPDDHFEAGGKRFVSLVRADIAERPAPTDIRSGLVAANLLRTAELLEHLLVAHVHALHLPAQMLFRAVGDCWLVGRYLIDGPEDAADRMLNSFDAQRTRTADLTGIERKRTPRPRPGRTKGMPQARQIAEYLDERDGLPINEQPVEGSARWWYGWVYGPMSDSAVHSGFGALERYVKASPNGFQFVARPAHLIEASRCFRLSVGAAANLLMVSYPYLGLETSRAGGLEHMQIHARSH